MIVFEFCVVLNVGHLNSIKVINYYNMVNTPHLSEKTTRDNISDDLNFDYFDTC